MGAKGKAGWRTLWHRLRGSEGVQIIELAVSLPLLMVIIVGIFDFGSAYHLKQNLSGAAREGARFASSLPTNDVYSVLGTPPSVAAVRNVVDVYLRANKINDCGLSTQAATHPSQLMWSYAAAGGGCPGGGLTLTIDRSFDYTASIGASRQVHVISTKVTISYPYKWEFGNVIGLLAPGAGYASGVTQITTVAVVPNMD